MSDETRNDDDDLEPTRDLSADPDETRSIHEEARPSSGDLPESVGRYRILGKLGEGGMGVVYEAEQENPRRRVAVKVIRGGRFIDETQVRMFQREADTLALLKHPGIGGIYESGRTEHGQHFFAMELVTGPTLSEYIARRPSAPDAAETRMRLELFRKIADAVHYAHQRGVIHRDLKPTNIVIDEEHASASNGRRGVSVPDIKILDFGLARITEGDIAAASMATEVGAIKGTLAYMSPEQARGKPDEIDVRADVYALGVILYEMLTGRRPYDLAGRALMEAVRVICEESPDPITRSWSGTARLDADVETIVHKALEKEADRRYGSAAALSEDVERHLTSQPIMARPPSARYQLKKFAARNRALVGGIVATFVVLIAGVTVSTVLGLREAAQRRAAEETRQNLEEVVEFQSDMLADLDPPGVGNRLFAAQRERIGAALETRGATEDARNDALASFDALLGEINSTDIALGVIDREILEPAADRIERRFGDQPEVAASLLTTLGETYGKLGLFESGRPHLEQALALRTRLLGNEHANTLDTKVAYCGILGQGGEYETGLKQCEEAVESARATLGDDHPMTLTAITYLGIAYQTAGQLQAAGVLFREALETRERTMGEDHPETLNSLVNLGWWHFWGGDWPNAERLYRRALEERRKISGNRHPATLSAMEHLGRALWSLGRNDEAEELFREALEGLRDSRGSDHVLTLRTAAYLGGVLTEKGELDEAETLVRPAFERLRRLLGEDHADTLWARGYLGDLIARRGDLEAAEVFTRETLAAFRRVFGPVHEETTGVVGVLANALAGQGRADEAEALLKDCIDELTPLAKTVDQMEAVGSCEGFLSQLYSKQNRWEEAEEILVRIHDFNMRTLGFDHPDTRGILATLATARMQLGRYEEAESGWSELWDYNRNVVPLTLDELGALRMLAITHNKLEDWPLAETTARELVELSRTLDPPAPEWVAEGLLALSISLGKQDRYAEGEPIIREARQIYRGLFSDEDWRVLRVSGSLAVNLIGQERFEDAERTLLEVYERREALPEWLYPNLLEIFVTLYEDWGREPEAAVWRRRVDEIRQPATD